MNANTQAVVNEIKRLRNEGFSLSEVKSLISKSSYRNLYGTKYSNSSVSNMYYSTKNFQKPTYVVTAESPVNADQAIMQSIKTLFPFVATNAKAQAAVKTLLY